MNQTDASYPNWVYHAEILVSAAFFALSTLLAKLAEREHVTAATITFFRFAIGLGILLVYMAAARTYVRPRNPLILVLRGVFNLLAVFLFYYAIKYTTITNANLLNLTPAKARLAHPGRGRRRHLPDRQSQFP
jgi:drug/metabolite transporter (DMT)-like permease